MAATVEPIFMSGPWDAKLLDYRGSSETIVDNDHEVQMWSLSLSLSSSSTLTLVEQYDHEVLMISLSFSLSPLLSIMY
jgi:hypothetical protein